MKTATLVLLLFAHPLAIEASPQATRTPTQFATTSNKSISRHSILKLRGGDVGPVSSKTLAKIFSVLAAGDALAGTIKPVEVWGKLGVEVGPGSKGEHYLGHGLGSSAASLAVTSYLSLSGRTSIDEAIGFGILTRCAYMTEMLLTGKYKELGVPTVPHVTIFLILLVTANGLLSGKDYGELAKVVSILLAGHGGLLFLNPRIDEDETIKKTAKVDGGYMFVSSIFAALLTFGVKPSVAMSYSAIFFIPLFLSVLDLVEAEKLCGLTPHAWAILLVAFLGVSAYGMLA
ncbi:hypothetical protein ACHAW6_003078 [Cyclotella cf. meneghiniana]